MVINMRCPSCGSEFCHVIEETDTNMKGFGIFKGLCGYIILGPIGWLCGLCGMGKGHTFRRAYWVCSQCGRKFKI